MADKGAVASLRHWLNDNGGKSMINQMTISGVKAVIIYGSDLGCFAANLSGLAPQDRKAWQKAIL